MTDQTRFRNLDSIGTISWLLMDACWMFDFSIGLIICATVALIFILLSLVAYRGVLSDHLEYVSSYLWFITNFIWAVSDMFEKDIMLYAKLAFGINALLIIANWLLFGKLRLARKISM